MDWIALLVGAAGLGAAVAAAVLWRQHEDQVLHHWLRRALKASPWDRWQGFSIGARAALASPRSGDWDLHAVGCVAAGAAETRAAIWIGFAGRLVVPFLFLLAMLLSGSNLCLIIGVAALVGAGALVWISPTEHLRDLGRLTVLWLLMGLAAAGLGRLGDTLELPFTLAPWSPLVNVAVFLGIGLSTQVAGVRRPHLLVAVAGLAGAGWLDVQAAAGLLVGGHFGAVLRLLHLARNEGAEARGAAFALVATRGTQSTVALLGMLAALPMLVQATGSPFATAGALFVVETLPWMVVVGVWAALGEPFEEWFRIRAGEGGGTGFPSIRLRALVLKGAEWRLQSIGKLAAKLAESGLSGKGASAFKVKQARSETDRLLSELAAIDRRRSTAVLRGQEAHEYEATQRCACARSELVDALIDWIQSEERAGIDFTHLRKLSDHSRRVRALVEGACRDAAGAPPSPLEAHRVTSALREFERQILQATTRGSLARARASHLARCTNDLHRLVELAVRCGQGPQTPRQPRAAASPEDQRAA